MKHLTIVLAFLMSITSYAQPGGGPPPANCTGGTGGNCNPISDLMVNDPYDVEPSAGDELRLATELNTGVSCVQYSIDSATASATNVYDAKPDCWADTVNKDVWFWFIATSQDMTISTDVLLFNLETQNKESGYWLYDTQLALYESSNDHWTGSITLLTCDEDAGINGTSFPVQNYGTPKQSVIEVTGLEPNKKYFVRLNAGSGATGGNFCISAFDTYTPGSKPCEAQIIYPNNTTCGDPKQGNTAVNWTSTNQAPYSTDGIQPNAYEPLSMLSGVDFSCNPSLNLNQYGVWNKFMDTVDVSGTEVITNLSGGARMYTIFSSTNCLHLSCVNSFTLQDNESYTQNGLTSGTEYYILTTLLANDMTQTFTTTLCLQNSNAPVHPGTQKNEGGVAGAGGIVNTDNYADDYYVTQNQAYQSTTYAANADGDTSPATGDLHSPCNVGSNIWFTWEVPADYPCRPGPMFVQVWNKNCTSGPLNDGIQIPLSFCETENQSCYNLQEPQIYLEKTGHLDWSTNVGWDANDYSGLHAFVFTGHNNEVCSFDFAVSDKPGITGIEATDTTINQGAGPITICASNATSYEWSTGETSACISVDPSTSTAYTVTATSGTIGSDIAYVTVLDGSLDTIPLTACDSFTSPSGKYIWTTSGIYNDTITGQGDYNDTLIFNLTINRSAETINAVACDSYTSPSGKVWTTSNTYLDTIPNTAGCDSVMTINLVVNSSSSSIISPTVCDSYTSPSGKVWTTSNTYLDTIPNAVECDSIMTINLTVNSSSSSTINPTVCGSYTSPSGKVWTTSNSYLDTIPNAVECDSIITINLVVNNSSSSTINVTTCNSYTSPSGKTWTTSNTYLDTIPNAVECDSVMAINLVVNSSSSSTISPTACDSYTSPSGKIWTASNTYLDTIPNTVECDSVMTINLVVNSSSSSTISPTVCDSYTSPSGKIWTASNTYLDTIPNIAGCDSIITINLVVGSNSSTSSISETACDSYISPSGKVWITSNTYLDTIPNAAGCDSVMTIDLIVKTSSTSSKSDTVCGSYTSPSGKVWITSNTYLDTISNAAGCDSLITIDLTIDCISSVSINDDDIDYRIFPNPTNGDAEIVFTQAMESVTITIINKLGEKIIEQTNLYGSRFRIDISSQAAGIYIIEVRQNNSNILRSKLIKQ